MQIDGGFGGGAAGVGIFPAGLGHGGSPPVHLGIVFFPEHPYFAGVVGEQVFVGEAHVAGEAVGAVGAEHDVAGVLVDLAGDEADILNVADAADGAGRTRGSVHAAGVELDDAFFIGQAAVADGVVAGVIFAAEADVVDGVEGIGAVEQASGGLPGWSDRR